MAGIFRKAALERLSSPERTDAPPLFPAHAGPAFVCAAALCVLCAVLFLVAPPVFPLALSGGVLAHPLGACAVPAPAAGVLSRVYAAPGVRISPDMPLMELSFADGTSAEVFSPCSGTIFSIAEVGQSFSAQTPVAAVTPAEGLCAVFSVPAGQAERIRTGQKADLIISETHYPASVASVDRSPSPQSALNRFFPQQGDPLCLVVLLPEADLSSTPDGLSVRAQILIP